MKHIEDMEQQALFDWAKIHKLNKYGWHGFLADYMLAIPNGGKRNPREAARMKKQGVKLGVSDVLLPIPKNGYCGLWLEMKKPKNAFKTASAARAAVTANQRDWIALMIELGYRAQVCYGFLDAKAVIQSYLDND